MSRFLILSALLVSLAGCNFLTGENGVFRDRNGDYTDARIAPPMSIPEDLDSYTLDQLYVIPEPLAANGEPFAEIPLPKPIEERRREGVIIQSLNDESWVLIDATPSQVWPMIRDYWTELQIQLDYESPGNGLMETAWLEIGGDTELRHKYRIAIEPGLHAGYSEVYIKHMSQARDSEIPSMLVWPEESDDPTLEQDAMRSVSQYLADRNDVYQASSASLLAGSIEGASKANLVQESSGASVLELKVDLGRAWVQVRQALVEAGVEILDSNREQSVMSVSFAGIVEDADEPGLIGRMLRRGGDDEAAPARDFSVRLMDTGEMIRVVTEPLESEQEAAGRERSAQLAADLLQVINDNLG